MTAEDLRFLRDKFGLENVYHWLKWLEERQRLTGSDARNNQTKALRDAVRLARWVLEHPSIKDEAPAGGDYQRNLRLRRLSLKRETGDRRP